MTRTSLSYETEPLLLSDAGFESKLLFIKGFDMPCFAAYPLARNAEGREAIKEYFKPIFNLARQCLAHVSCKTGLL